MRAATIATLALAGCYALLAPACCACDTDAIRNRVQSGGHEVTSIDANDGIVTFVLSTRRSAATVALAVHARGTRLFTSAMGAEVDESAMADVGELAGRWNADTEMQRLLRDCGVGFADSDAADPIPALRRAAEKALARHGRVLHHVVSGWSMGIAVFIATVAMVTTGRRWRWRRLAALTAIVAILPLGWMAFRTVGFDWYPTGDHAAIELRTRDVGTLDTPLVGSYSHGWHHPGPMMFYAYALPYRMTGGASWSQLTAAGVCNVVAAATALAIAWRAGGLGLVCSFSVGLAVLLANLGVTSVDPWDASVPILPFVCVILAACSAANGDRVALIVSVVAGSFVAQTYIGFAGPIVALWSFVFLSVLRLPGGRRTVLVAVGVLIACWTPVLYDQLFGFGNLGALARYFSQGHRPIGWREALGITARHLSVTAPWLGFPEPGDQIAGVMPSSPMLLVFPVAAFLGSALGAYRRHAREALTLQLAVATAVAAGFIVTSRISDVAFSFRVRSWWAIGMCWWVSIIWACLSCVPGRRLRLTLSFVLCCLAMAVSLNTLTSAEGIPPGEGERLQPITEATLPVVANRQRVLVRSVDPDAVPLTLGLILQLEKHGIPVAALDDFELGSRTAVPSTATTANALLILVAAGDSPDRLRWQAEQQVSRPSDLRLVASYGNHPRTSVAVFSFEDRERSTSDSR